MMEHFSHISNIADIKARVDVLNETLEWEQQAANPLSPTDDTWFLVSKATKRVLTHITRRPNGFYVVGGDNHHDGDLFNSLAPAKEYGKFSFIKMILREDLGSRFLQ
jgi:hypothetical protein